MLSRKFSAKKKPKIGLVCLLLAGGLVYLYLMLRPYASAAVEYQGKIIAVRMVTDAVTEVLADETINYDELFSLSNDQTGKIASITTNSIYVNKLANLLTKEITEKLSGERYSEYKLPIGTFFGNELLLGRGFDITLKVSPIGYADTKIISELSQAGINQICHSLYLKTDISFTTLIPLYNANFSLSNEFMIAEAVIMGEIPESYTQISGIDNENASKYDSLIIGK